MFKKGDVVTYCGKTEDAGFDVRVTDVDTLRVDEFYGVIVHANVGSYFEEYSDEESAWDVKQFKLKQQAVVTDGTNDNVFPVLKDGMIVTTRERGSYLVCADKVMRHEGYNRLASYEKDGKHKGSNSKFDIVQVYSGENLYNLGLAEYVADYPEDLVWEEQKNAKAIVELEDQIYDLQEQLSVMKEKLTTLREEKQ